jgi:hypothetical protein
MTRGSAYCFYIKDNILQIAFTDEWNGGMSPDDLGGDLVDLMIKQQTRTDFMLACYEFNKENHNYKEFQCHTLPLHKYLEKKDPVVYDPLGGNEPYKINMSDDYYRYWFSDYLYFINLSDIPIKFKIDTEDVVSIDFIWKRLLHTQELAVLNFGNIVYKLNQQGLREQVT